MEPGHRILAVLVATCLLTLGLGFFLKDQCNGANWGDQFQYRAVCYNDIAPLYGARFFHKDAFPYVPHPDLDRDSPRNDYDAAKPDTHAGFVEYPVLTGLLMWLAAKFGTVRTNLLGDGMEETAAEFYYWNAFLLSLFALGTVFLLWRMAPAPGRTAYFAAGSPLVLYAFHNWDLMAVFFTILGLYWFERGRWATSGVAFACGASAKLFPILIPPLLFLHLVRSAYERPASRARVPWAVLRAAWGSGAGRRFVLGTLGGLALINLPFLLGSRTLFLEIFRFHARRSPNIENIYAVVDYWGDRLDIGFITRLDNPDSYEHFGALALVAVYALVAVAVWTRRASPRGATFAAVLLFLILNKIYSAQYALWVLPFFALVELPAWSYAAYAGADAWVYFTLFPYFEALGRNYDRYLAGLSTFDEFQERTHLSYRWVSLAIVARYASLVALLVILAVRAVRAPRDPRAASGGDGPARSAGRPGPGPEPPA